MYVDSVKIDVKKLIKSGLSIQSYFILICISNDYKELLELYVNKCGKIDRSDFKFLKDEGYLNIKNEFITFDNLEITDKTKELFDFASKLDHKRFFAELKDVYPSRIKIATNRFRTLHCNMSECAKKYRVIVDSEETHNKIIKCVKMYVKELENSNKLEFIQQLPTWINQRNYEAYLDRINEGAEISDNVQYDVI